ncbi:MAG: D-alanine--D-alanine ligase [Kiritimatiellia bacterium]
MKKIAVLMGGTSNERKISLKSGRAVVDALENTSCRVVPVVLDADSVASVPRDVDVVFIALHGGYGENGGIQSDLDRLGIPYTGPGAESSQLAMDKVATKKLLKQRQIPTAPWELRKLGDKLSNLVPPVVVKPPREGSSLGISRVEDTACLEKAIKAACAADPCGEALIEKYVPGREWTVSILGGEALPVVEIIAPGGWYGFKEKYTRGLTDFAFPDMRREEALIAVAQCYALLAYQSLGCRGVSRVDFRVTDDGDLSILEINTIPGMTSTSLLPRAAARAGLNFSDLCLKLIELADCD